MWDVGGKVDVPSDRKVPVMECECVQKRIMNVKEARKEL